MRAAIICSIACAMLVLQAEAQAQPAAITGKNYREISQPITLTCLRLPR
jgi:hypothetical protein